MVSPLNDFYNTLLYIPTSTGSIAYDIKGNPVLGEATEIEYKAFLKEDTSDSKVRYYQGGVDTASQYFKGYLTDPIFLPSGFTLPATVNCKKQKGDRWIEGTFELENKFMSVKIVETIVGETIQGYFTVKK